MKSLAGKLLERMSGRKPFRHKRMNESIFPVHKTKIELINDSGDAVTVAIKAEIESDGKDYQEIVFSYSGRGVSGSYSKPSNGSLKDARAEAMEMMDELIEFDGVGSVSDIEKLLGENDYY